MTKQRLGSAIVNVRREYALGTEEEMSKPNHDENDERSRGLAFDKEDGVDDYGRWWLSREVVVIMGGGGLFGR